MQNNYKNEINISCLSARQVNSNILQMAKEKSEILFTDLAKNNKLRRNLEILRQSDDIIFLLRRLQEFSYLSSKLNKELRDWQWFLVSQLSSVSCDLRILVADILARQLSQQSELEIKAFYQKYFIEEDLVYSLLKNNCLDILAKLADYFLQYINPNEKEFYIEKIFNYSLSLTGDNLLVALKIKLLALLWENTQSLAIKDSCFTSLKEIYINSEEELSIAVLWQVYTFLSDEMSSKSYLLSFLKERELEYYSQVSMFINTKLQNQCPFELERKSLYHSNLKSSFPVEVKLFQIEILKLLTKTDDLFYMAMHYTNMLKVSNNQLVLTASMEALMEIFPNLEDNWQSDVVREMMRFLEVDQSLNARFVAFVLGELLAYINMDDYAEISLEIQYKIKTAQSKIVNLLIISLRELLSSACIWQKKVEAIKLLLLALGHFEPEISDNAYSAFGQIFATEKNNDKLEIYRFIAKKILDLSVETKAMADLVSSTVALACIADFIEIYQQEHGQIVIDLPSKVAFYPGSFDPFSEAHLSCAKIIRDLGFEVYLAVDEFSWSKRTQAYQIRRQIVNMAIASEENIYVYPEAEPVNISNTDDLSRLKANFNGRDLYLLMGADVLTGASAYSKEPTATVLTSFSHIIFERKQQAKQELLNSRIRELKADVIRLNLPVGAEAISSTLIRGNIDKGISIADLVDPMVESYIAQNGLYRFEPLFKDTMTTSSIELVIVEEINRDLIEKLSREFDFSPSEFELLLNDKCHIENTRILLIRDSKQDDIIAFSLFHWLRSKHIYYEFASEEISDYIREQALGRISVIDALFVKQNAIIKNIEQVLLCETLSFNLAKDYSYAIYNPAFIQPNSKINTVLKRQGFIPYNCPDNKILLTVDMTAPITFNFDVKTMIKAPFRDDIAVNMAIDRARERIQMALVQFYRGKLVLGFDRTMMYEHLVKLICQKNEVECCELLGRKLGENMLVTYGNLFKRWRIPNTVTKALHSERYYREDLKEYGIASHPNYLALNNQIKTIASFKRPVILIDDLMDKGKRFKILHHEIANAEIPVKALVAAILTGRGKAYMEMNDIDVSAAYYIPRIKYWFNESMIYPFIGGDAVAVKKSNAIDAFYSVNQLLPYTYPTNLAKDIPPKVVKEFSLACLQSAREIMLALEKSYYQRYGRILSLYNHSAVFISPRFPYNGKTAEYNLSKTASDYLADDIEKLERIGFYYE